MFKLRNIIVAMTYYLVVVKKKSPIPPMHRTYLKRQYFSSACFQFHDFRKNSNSKVFPFAFCIKDSTRNVAKMHA